jgi:cytochrome c peroxidase
LRSAWIATAALLGAASLAGADAYDWRLPRGFPTPAVPADNPMSDAKVALGERLFFDPRLSVTGRHSCASCHEPARAFTDGRSRAVGATGQLLRHNSMSLANAAYNVSFGWSRPDIRSLEEQMFEPLTNEHPIELGLAGREATVVGALEADATYREAFAAAFPHESAPLSFTNVVKAIAAFERTLVSGGSAFDRLAFAGEHDALSAQARRGMALFFSPTVGCSGCHSGLNFAGNWVDAQGATGETSFADNGTGLRLRVPSLRNVALTAPYMHDGRFASLAAALDHYAANDGRGDMRLGGALRLSAGERRALVAFLESLTDPQFVARYARYSLPVMECGASTGFDCGEPRSRR